MIRFFADPQYILTDEIRLSTEDSEHIRSLRLRPDEQFIVCDTNGTDYICKLSGHQSADGAHGGRSIAKIIDRKKTTTESSVKCTAYIAYTKGDRLDYAVQKSVELGVYRIVLFKSARSIAAPKDSTKKIERLQKIALETAKQSGRGIIPEVTGLGEFKNVVSVAAVRSELAVMCYEDEKNLHLKTVLEHFYPYTVLLDKPKKRVKSIGIITGPEGGFEPFEVDLARSKDISIASLGPRILRSETAPVAALAAIMYHTENL